MKRRPVHMILAAIVLAALTMGGCNPSNKKRLNDRVTLWRSDKIPYGGWYFYDNLKSVFPNAEIVVDKESPDRSGPFNGSQLDIITKIRNHRKRTASIVLSSSIEPTDEEMQAMLNFVYAGNYLFLSAFDFSKELLDTFGLAANNNYAFSNFGDSLTVSVARPGTGERKSFSYPGKAYDNFFGKVDSVYDTQLGWDEKGRPNFVRINYNSGGAVFVQLAPMAYTNFFLLHKQNKEYYDYTLSYLPKGIELITWGEYFRNHRRGNDSDYSRALSWIMSQPPLATATWMLLFLMLLLFLFESKRRQRLIETIPPLRNASLDFVNTIGRLYFQRRDNRNLAEKMSAHFLDQVRNRYNMSTTRLDEQFEQKLAYKTGYQPEVLRQLLYKVKHLPQMPQVSDEELLDFNRELDKFYKLT